MLVKFYRKPKREKVRGNLSFQRLLSNLEPKHYYKKNSFVIFVLWYPKWENFLTSPEVGIEEQKYWNKNNYKGIKESRSSGYDKTALRSFDHPISQASFR